MNNQRALELARRHGELKMRIAQQRQSLAAQSQPIEAALARGDAVLKGVDWLKHHPGAVGLAVASAVILKPRRAWVWAKRGFFLWRGWQSLRAKLFGAV